MGWRLGHRSARSDSFALSDEDLAAIRATVKECIEGGTPEERKGLLQTLLADVRVESRDEIYPIFRIPQAEFRGRRLRVQAHDPKFPEDEALEAVRSFIAEFGHVPNCRSWQAAGSRNR